MAAMRITVAVRVRPLTARGLMQQQQAAAAAGGADGDAPAPPPPPAVRVPPGTAAPETFVLANQHEWAATRTVVMAARDRPEPKRFGRFACVLLPDDDQERTYASVMPALVDAFVGGRDCVLIAYGCTATGKTHSLFGPPECTSAAALADVHDGAANAGDADDAADADAAAAAAAADRGIPKSWGTFPRAMVRLLRRLGIDEAAEAPPAAAAGAGVDGAGAAGAVRDDAATHKKDADVEPPATDVKTASENGGAATSAPAAAEAAGAKAAGVAAAAADAAGAGAARPVEPPGVPEPRRAEPAARPRITVSAVEVYLENVYDFFDAHRQVRVGAGGAAARRRGGGAAAGPARAGRRPAAEPKARADEVPLRNLADVTHVLRVLEHARVHNHTAMNYRSSRSHAVVTATLTPVDAAARPRKFVFVDLAGCERLSASGASGAALRELVSINASLEAFGRVMSAVVRGEAHVPFRDTTVTKLLRPYLTPAAAVAGDAARNPLVSMLLTAAPDEGQARETLSALRLGHHLLTEGRLG